MELEKKYIDSIANSFEKILNGNRIVVLLDEKGKIIFANDFFLKLSGYDDRIKGKDFFEIFIFPEENVKDVFENVISGKYEQIHINHIRKADGNKKLILWDNYLLKDLQGNPLTLSLGNDITLIEEYREDLGKINRLFTSNIESADDKMKEICKEAWLISGASCFMYNKIYDNKVKTVYRFGVPESFPYEFIGEDSPCLKVYESMGGEFETGDDFPFNFGSFKKYYGHMVKSGDTKYGILCFLFESKDAEIKKDRIRILADYLGREEERKRLNDGILAEKNRYKLFFDRMPYGVYFMSWPDKKIEYMNDRAFELTGYNKEELYAFGKDVFEKIIHPEDKQKFIDFVASDDAFKSSIRLRWVKKNGSIIWTERMLTPSYDEKGNLKYIFAVVRDITAEKKYNEDINSYNKAILLASQIDSIFIKSKHEEIFIKVLNTLINITSSKYGFMGLLDENSNLNCVAMTENVYRDCKMGDSISHSFIKNSSSLWSKALLENKVKVINFNGKVPNGHVEISSAIAMPMSYGDKVYGVIILANSEGGYSESEEKIVGKILSHISDRIYTLLENEKLKKREERMRESIIKAARLESVGVLAAGIAHDFNNILTSIMANMSILKEKVSGELREIADETLENADAAKSLASQLMFFSKKVKPLIEKTDSNVFLKDLFNFLARGVSANTEIKLDAKINGLEIDRGQIRQALSNIFINASQAVSTISDPKINICIENIEIGKDDVFKKAGHYVKISIRDNGVGIDKEKIERIFEPYFTTKEKGSGLGLYMTFAIIKKHDGYIDVKSEKGQGTEFIVYLPSMADPFVEKGTKDLIVESHNLSILIVDDEEIILKSLGRILKSFACEYYTATNSTLAYEIAKTKSIDIAIIDLTLKRDESGQNINTKLKEIKPDLYTVMSSGYSEEVILSDYKKYKFDNTMPKPYKIDDVKNIISDYIKKRKKA